MCHATTLLDLSDAYEAGSAARNSGDPITANPFKCTELRFGVWRTGWNDTPAPSTPKPLEATHAR